MALPPSTIEQFGREPARSPGWSGRLMMFSMTAFILAVVAYVGLNFGFARTLDKAIADLNSQLQVDRSGISEQDKVQLITYNSKVVNLDKLVSQHIYSSNAIRFVEANTLNDIYFNRAELMSDNSRMALTGVAGSVESITRQVRAFEQSPDVVSASFSNVSAASDGRWQFDLTVNFKKDLLTRRPNILSTASLSPGSNLAADLTAKTTSTSGSSTSAKSTSTPPAPRR